MEIVKQLENDIQQKHLSTHPFYESWNEGKVTLEALQGYAQQYYHFVQAFPRLITILQESAPEGVDFSEHIEEETSHIELWADFARALGVDPEAPATRETAEFVGTMERLCRKDFYAGCAALLAYEGQVSEIAVLKKKGLVEHYNLKDGLVFFDEHAVVDIEHQKIWKKFLEDAPDTVREDMNQALDAQWQFLDGVVRVYC